MTEGYLVNDNRNICEIAILFGVVETVSYYKSVGNFKTDVFDRDLVDAGLGFAEECRDGEGGGSSGLEDVAKVLEGEAGVHDVFDENDMLPFDVNVVVFFEVDDAGGLAFAVPTGDLDVVNAEVEVNGAGEIADVGDAPFEDADEDNALARVVGGDFCPHFGDFRLDVCGGDEGFEGGHDFGGEFI